MCTKHKRVHKPEEDKNTTAAKQVSYNKETDKQLERQTDRNNHFIDQREIAEYTLYTKDKTILL